eukprot:6490461-Amphidinium_carterae.1
MTNCPNQLTPKSTLDVQGGRHAWRQAQALEQSIHVVKGRSPHRKHRKAPWCLLSGHIQKPSQRFPRPTGCPQAGSRHGHVAQKQGYPIVQPDRSMEAR